MVYYNSFNVYCWIWFANILWRIFASLLIGEIALSFSFLFKFIYLWLCWVFVAAWAFSSCGKQGLLFVVVHGLLIAVASLVVEHGL